MPVPVTRRKPTLYRKAALELDLLCGDFVPAARLKRGSKSAIIAGHAPVAQSDRALASEARCGGSSPSGRTQMRDLLESHFFGL